MKYEMIPIIVEAVQRFKPGDCPLVINPAKLGQF